MPSTSWTLNGETKERSGNTTILDTGTTLLLVSDDVVDAFYGAIKGATFDDQQGGYKFPSDATVPDISFAVGDKLYKVCNPACCRRDWLTMPSGQQEGHRVLGRWRRVHVRWYPEQRQPRLRHLR